MNPASNHEKACRRSLTASSFRRQLRRWRLARLFDSISNDVDDRTDEDQPRALGSAKTSESQNHDSFPLICNFDRVGDDQGSVAEVKAITAFLCGSSSRLA
jgi:hypothetical protein